MQHSPDILNTGNRKVIYTAIFGGKDELLQPTVSLSEYDFICFADERSAAHKSFKNPGPWEVRIVTPTHDDPVRSARRYKLLPHEYLKEYEVSVWVDGNFIVRGNPDPLIEKYLNGANVAVYDHMQETFSLRDCIYDEADELIRMFRENGRYKDDPDVIRRHMERYRREGYPAHNGLLISSVMLRRHNAEDAVALANLWWSEMERGSRRDQLSFNYAAWKLTTTFNWIPGDVRDNPYFKRVYHPEHRVTLRRRIELIKKKIFS